VAKEARPPLGRGYPRPVGKRRVMPDVLGMSTLEVGHPLLNLVLMETQNPL